MFNGPSFGGNLGQHMGGPLYFTSNFCCTLPKKKFKNVILEIIAQCERKQDENPVRLRTTAVKHRSSDSLFVFTSFIVDDPFQVIFYVLRLAGTRMFGLQRRGWVLAFRFRPCVFASGLISPRIASVCQKRNATERKPRNPVR